MRYVKNLILKFNMQNLIKNNCLGVMCPELTKEWHPVKNKHLTPFDISAGSHKKFWWLCKNGHEFEDSPHNRNRTQKKNYCLQCNSVAFLRPYLLSEWNYKKNKNINPEMVLSYSRKKVWWLCKEGHEWEDRICKRSLGWGNCKVCNSFGFLFPKLAKEWHPTKNGKLMPWNVSQSSSKKVWWKCEKGHEWESTVLNRVGFEKQIRKGRGCPYCSHQKVYKEISLEFLNSKLVKEWHPTKNGRLTPKDVTSNSTKKVWWKCKKCNSEWKDSVNRRALSKSCPYCDGKRVNETNSLASLNHKLAKEWNFTKNRELTPCDVTCKSSKKVWWKCLICDYEWKSTINERNNGQSKCLKCRSLGALYPKLLKEWDFSKNKNIDPFLVIPGDSMKVWWTCSHGHKFDMVIANRVGQRQNCPYCSNHRVCNDNCLATLNSDLAKEWHPIKNGGLTPNNVTTGSGKKVWWKCSICGREWEAKIYTRNNGHGCSKWHSKILKNGISCASYVEAYMYLKYEKSKLKFIHNKTYKGLGRSRYDFYFPKENKYVEVTSFSNKFHYKHGQYFSYLRKIIAKKRHVENVLKARFEFIQFGLDGKQLVYVRQNLQNNPHRSYKVQKVK